MTFSNIKTERPGGLAPPDVSPRVHELLTMLTYKRPAWSEGEAAFILRYLTPLGCRVDKFGNRILRVGKGSRILWSCHTDTVHRTSGGQGVVYGAGIATSNSGECLGADCTAGVWLMVNMIRNKIPGLYVFHRAEEIGCKGSRWIADNTPELLVDIDFAVAFDRRGCNSIVTHQVGLRTASDVFARSLATALVPLKYRADDTGIYTDTDSYARHVAECTNIGVGYEGAHNKSESQDVDHLVKLLDVILKADFSGLVCARAPNEPEYVDDPAWDRKGSRVSPLEDYVARYPDVVADFLESMGFSEEDITDWDCDRYTDEMNDNDPMGDNRR